MFTRDPGAPFDTPNAVIRRQGHNELTLSFRPLPYLSTLLLVPGTALVLRHGPKMRNLARMAICRAARLRPMPNAPAAPQRHVGGQRDASTGGAIAVAAGGVVGLRPRVGSRPGFFPSAEEVLLEQFFSSHALSHLAEPTRCRKAARSLQRRR